MGQSQAKGVRIPLSDLLTGRAPSNGQYPPLPTNTGPERYPTLAASAAIKTLESSTIPRMAGSTVHDERQCLLERRVQNFRR